MTFHSPAGSRRFDLNSEFYRLQTAGLFLNGSFGVGPEFSSSGLEGPSIFPDTSVGARLAFKPTPNVVVRGAVLDGVPVDRPDGSVGAFKSGDGVLVVSEAAFLNRTARGEPTGKVRFRIGRASGLPPYDNKVAVGGWYYTGTFDDLSDVNPSGKPVSHHGSGGVYGLADVTLFRSHPNRGRRVAGFVQAGLGDGRVDRFGSYLGAGVVGTGFSRGARWMNWAFLWPWRTTDRAMSTNEFNLEWGRPSPKRPLK
jgi:porin